MNQDHIDEQLVQALNFCNQVLLDKCLHQINYSLIGNYTKKQNKSNQNATKSKFQKPSLKANTIKTKSVKSVNSFQNVFLKPQQQSYHNLSNFVTSKVKINPTQLDVFYLQNQKKPQQSSFFNTSQRSPYTIDEFLKQTSISTKNKQSPINQWKTNSLEKNQYNSFEKVYIPESVSFKTKALDFEPIKQQKVIIQKPGPQNGQSKSVSTKKTKGKFQKSKSQTKISKPATKSPQIPSSHKKQQKQQDLIKIEVEWSESKPTTSQSPRFSKEKQSQSPSKPQPLDFRQNTQTRDTCQLAPSKLQKIMQVQDNKYKQIILKTYYKHQH